MSRFYLGCLMAMSAGVRLHAEVVFKEHVINPDAGTGLAIAAADINHDGKLDIVGVSADDIAWYENPTWERHLIANTIKNSNVCVAPHDLDGDGIPELALGADWQFNNTKSGGSLFLLKSGTEVRSPWRVIPLLEVEPTLHRIRWADTDGDGAPELIVAPLKGRNSTPPYFQDTAARLFLLRPPADLLEPLSWKEEMISDDYLHVVHNIVANREAGAASDVILTASYEGVTKFRRDNSGHWSHENVVTGNPEQLPNIGAGEIKVSDNRGGMILTVEPWHGTNAVVYDAGQPRKRYVIDDALAGGHAVAWADFDGDGNDEAMVGFREKAGPKALPGLNVYWIADAGVDGLSFTKQIVDEGGMATEDAVVADFTGDGKPDIAAFGRATHNIKLYENTGRK